MDGATYVTAERKDHPADMKGAVSLPLHEPTAGFCVHLCGVDHIAQLERSSTGVTLAIGCAGLTPFVGPTLGIGYSQ
jgi:hypothetical protein